jgi:hypothetical protein
MNNAQIKNGEVRIFPYYKGEYMGKSDVEFGFSNKNSALKYMRDIPKEDIYESIGGYEKYYMENAYLYGLNKKALYTFNPYPFSSGPYEKNRKTGGCYDHNYERINLKDLENPEEIRREIESMGFISDMKPDDRWRFKEFEEKYGLFPDIWIDDKAFVKARTKFIKENVEFKKGIVKISVEYLDE